ncbi:MAG TPA: (2Fe-2S)-binding protein [Victivallales bacterium]|nr:(2Fe-2S)-binding protein [Victivallales bacterium]
MSNKIINLVVNGVKKEFSISPNEKLLDVLRREGYKGTKFGCGEGSCGACTVLLEGKPVYACIMYAFQADGKALDTIEGVGSAQNPHKIQRALIDQGAVQCGFCMPGMILSAKSMFEENSKPDEEFIRTHMDGNLCRCTGYEKILTALENVAASNK